jgi:hypothetical protein
MSNIERALHDAMRSLRAGVHNHTAEHAAGVLAAVVSMASSQPDAATAEAVQAAMRLLAAYEAL